MLSMLLLVVKLGMDVLGYTFLEGEGILDWLDSSPLILDIKSFRLFWNASLGVEYSLTNFFLIWISTENGFSEIL